MSAIAEKPWVVTFDEEKHRYFLNGRRVPLSVTGVLTIAGFQNFDGIPFEVLDAKRRLGKNVHRATEFMDKGLGVDWETLSFRAMPYVLAYQKFLDKYSPKWEMIEHRGVMDLNGMICGYTLDRAGWIDGKPYMVDFKTAVEHSPAWAYQTAAYSLAAPRLNGQVGPYHRMALQLNPDEDFKEFPYTNHRHDESVFRSALHISSIHVLEGRVKDND